MIRFNFDWSSTINQGILALVLLLFIMPWWFLVWKNKQGVKGRRALRLGLHVLLGLVVWAFVLQPFAVVERASGTGVVLGKDITSDFVRKIRASHPLVEVLDLSQWEGPGQVAVMDTVVLAGNVFDDQVFRTLLEAGHLPMLKWISQEETLEGRQWKGLVRKGELQTVTGKIRVLRKEVLRVRFGDQVLDSIGLAPGYHSFRLTFPVFTEGRTSVLLALGEQTLDTIRFFARSSSPLTFRFQMDSPDFETRTLATWLGKNGHAVQYNTTLSKGMESKQTINQGGKADVIITEVHHAGDPAIKKELKEGKSVLFVHLTNPLQELPLVNRALGTQFAAQKVEKDTSGSAVEMPYRFIDNSGLVRDEKYPVAVAYGTGSVGVSLLGETFPLVLSGDSITYSRLWDSVLDNLRPASKNNLAVRAPVYPGLLTEFGTNEPDTKSEWLDLGADSVYLFKSALNTQSARGSFRPTQAGWLPLTDSLHSEIYVEERVSGSAKVQDFIRSYTLQRKSVSLGSPDGAKEVKRKIPDWGWFVLILLCLTALWVERKWV